MDWSDLPLELLGSILERLPVADHLRFGLVCSSWRSAAKSNLYAPAAQSPWLMLPFNPRATSPSAKSSARFYSLSERKVYRIPLPAPPVADRLRIGSSHGWLITADETSELHLLNPITGAQHPLPSVTTFPFVEALRDRKGRVTCYNLYLGDDDSIPPESFAPDQLRYFFYEKAVLSSDHTVMLIHNPLFKLALAGAGDMEWTMVDTPSSYWVDAIFTSNGQFFTLESMGGVEAWDLHGPLPTSAVVAPSMGYFDCSKYLVELPAGRLLQVRRWREPVRLGYNWEPRLLYVEHTTTRVEVFELRPGRNGGASWVKKDKEGLSGFALFLGKNGSLCASTGECPELEGNCVYFTDDGTWAFEKSHDVVPDVGIFDLGDGRLKPCSGYDFQWIWPPPIWVSPTM